jgi:predicted N-acyltransferase
MAQNTIRFVDSIFAIGKEAWQSLSNTDYPFLRFEFLAALEDSQCIDSIKPANLMFDSETGWLPYYAVLESKDNITGETCLLAIAPIFKKLHSYGEYVFDWLWADAYQQHGFNYYPKLVWAIPFTPATGPRIVSLGDAEEQSMYYQQIANGLTAQCQQKEFSSWHCLFSDSIAQESLAQYAFVKDSLVKNALNQPDAEPFLESSLEPFILERTSCQFHWFNNNGNGQTFRDFDNYLQTFTSRKRKNVNKERRRLIESGFELSRKLGDEMTAEDIADFYHCYQLTYAKRNMRGYLTLDFFQQLLLSMPDQLMLVQAKLKDECGKLSKTLACALYFYDQETLYGRYWGCKQEYDSLHFECCYYQGIEFCIEHQLKRFDPGTQGEHKISRGFQPTLCHSQHWIAQPDFRRAIKGFLKQEGQQIETYAAQASRHLPFKSTRKETITPDHD